MLWCLAQSQPVPVSNAVPGGLGYVPEDETSKKKAAPNRHLDVVWSKDEVIEVIID